jgi:hypothetical protein
VTVCAPDYRMDGKEEIIVLSAEGEVRGYLPVSDEAQRATLDGATEEKLLHELTARKNVCPVLLECVAVLFVSIRPPAIIPCVVGCNVVLRVCSNCWPNSKVLNQMPNP